MVHVVAPHVARRLTYEAAVSLRDRSVTRLVVFAPKKLGDLRRYPRGWNFDDGFRSIRRPVVPRMGFTGERRFVARSLVGHRWKNIAQCNYWVSISPASGLRRVLVTCAFICTTRCIYAIKLAGSVWRELSHQTIGNARVHRLGEIIGSAALSRRRLLNWISYWSLISTWSSS